MPYRIRTARNAAARRRYRLNADQREDAKARSSKQRDRLKIDDAYRERRNAWQRRWRRKRAQQTEGEGGAQ